MAIEDMIIKDIEAGQNLISRMEAKPKIPVDAGVKKQDKIKADNLKGIADYVSGLLTYSDMTDQDKAATVLAINSEDEAEKNGALGLLGNLYGKGLQSILENKDLIDKASLARYTFLNTPYSNPSEEAKKLFANPNKDQIGVYKSLLGIIELTSMPSVRATLNETYEKILPNAPRSLVTDITLLQILKKSGMISDKLEIDVKDVIKAYFPKFTEDTIKYISSNIMNPYILKLLAIHEKDFMSGIGANIDQKIKKEVGESQFKTYIGKTYGIGPAA